MKASRKWAVTPDGVILEAGGFRLMVSGLLMYGAQTAETLFRAVGWEEHGGNYWAPDRAAYWDAEHEQFVWDDVRALQRWLPAITYAAIALMVRESYREAMEQSANEAKEDA